MNHSMVCGVDLVFGYVKVKYKKKLIFLFFLFKGMNLMKLMKCKLKM